MKIHPHILRALAAIRIPLLILLLAPVPGVTDGVAAQQPEAAAGARQQPISLTLEDAIDIALARSPSIRQAEAAHLRDGAGGWEAWDRLLPTLSLSGGLSQSEVLQRTASDPITGGIIQLPDSLIQLRESFGTQTTLTARWLLFDGGRSIQNVRRSRAEIRAAELSFEAARARIAGTVTIAFLDALEAAAMEEAVRADLARAEELERTATGRFDVGEVPEVDALQARLTVGDAELSLMEAEASAAAALLTLLQHLDLPATSEVRLVEPGIPDRSLLDAPEVLRQRAMDESVDVAALQARFEAARRTHAGQRWWFVPSVSVVANWTRSEFGQSRDALTFSPRNEQSYYGLALSWSPMERFGGTLADERRARAGVDAARAEIALREAALEREVEMALNRMDRARVLEERSAVNLQLAERQREQADERYRLGLAPLVERITAEALAAEAQRQAIVARYAMLRSLAELETASGVRFLTEAVVRR